MSQSAIEICITASLCIGVFNTGMLCVALYMASREWRGGAA